MSYDGPQVALTSIKLRASSQDANQNTSTGSAVISYSSLLDQSTIETIQSEIRNTDGIFMNSLAITT